MPSHEAPRSIGRSASIRTPDQLQQARRPDAARSGPVAERPRQAQAAEPRGAGVLGQLETERAHD